MYGVKSGAGRVFFRLQCRRETQKKKNRKETPEEIWKETCLETAKENLKNTWKVNMEKKTWKQTRNGSNEQHSVIRIRIQKIQNWPGKESNSFEDKKIFLP